MLLHQLFAIILYSSWHYGRIFHDNQSNNMDNNKAISKILFILLMSYCLYSWTNLFFAFTMSKFIFDVYRLVINYLTGPVSEQYKWDMRDSIVGIICWLLYTIG